MALPGPSTGFPPFPSKGPYVSDSTSVPSRLSRPSLLGSRQRHCRAFEDDALVGESRVVDFRETTFQGGLSRPPVRVVGTPRRWGPGRGLVRRPWREGDSRGGVLVRLPHDGRVDQTPVEPYFGRGTRGGPRVEVPDLRKRRRPRVLVKVDGVNIRIHLLNNYTSDGDPFTLTRPTLYCLVSGCRTDSRDYEWM